MEEYRKANNKSDTTTARTNSKWLSPNEDTIKINFDGAHDQGSDRAGLGIVARNAEGHVIFAGSKRAWGVHDAEQAECMAPY